MNYKEYYLNQAGGQYDVFRGTPMQRGYGLGSMFKSMYRYILPLFKTHAVPALKQGAQFVGTEAIKAASNIAKDAIKGEDISSSFKNHSNNAINAISDEAKSKLQIGKGKKQKRKKNTLQSKKNKKTRRISDIFG
jgi:hypothetical protein